MPEMRSLDSRMELWSKVVPKSPKSGPTGCGFKRHNGKLVAHEDEAPIRLHMFELFAEHQRKKTVAEILNAEGHRTRANVFFTAQTISRLLSEKAVTGVEGEDEAIVPQELWERCNAILRAQKNAGGAKRTATHLFSDLVHCTCGQKMYVPSNGRKYVCSDCRNKIATDDLEVVFRSQLKSYHLPNDTKQSTQNLHHDWPELPFKFKREFVETITKRIEVADNKVTCFLFSL